MHGANLRVKKNKKTKTERRMHFGLLTRAHLMWLRQKTKFQGSHVALCVPLIVVLHTSFRPWLQPQKKHTRTHTQTHAYRQGVNTFTKR